MKHEGDHIGYGANGTPVPEPASASLLGLAIVGGIASVLRRKRAS